jgi:sugar O-acyltransferase (sialic acid O-acetyltransferase NeuD family)
MKLLILGAGTFAVEVLEIVESKGEFEPVGFLTSLAKPAPGTRHAGLPVYAAEEMPLLPDQCVCVAGIVSTRRRDFVEAMLARGYRFVTVAHRSAHVSPRATIGQGCAIGAAAIIAAHTRLGDHIIVNRGALIGHDEAIGAFTTIGPGANLAGGLSVGRGCYIGIGAVIRDHLTIGDGAVVGAGAVVVNDVPAGVVVTGVPARISKTGVDGF